MNKLGIGLFLITFHCLAYADLYFEFGIEGGGDTFVTAKSTDDDFSLEQDLNIGGGFKFAAGYNKNFGEDTTSSISLSLGYLWDSIDADNGDADFATFTLDAIYNIHLNKHHIGIGATYHIGPEYQDDIDGFSKTDIEFDDATGLILQYRFEITPWFYFGLRRTEIDYEIGDVTVDASGNGLFFVFTGEL